MVKNLWIRTFRVVKGERETGRVGWDLSTGQNRIPKIQRRPSVVFVWVLFTRTQVRFPLFTPSTDGHETKVLYLI